MRRIIGLTIIIAAMGLFSCNNESADVQTMNEELSEKSATVALNEVKMEAASTESEYQVEFFANMEQKLWRWWKIGKHFKWNQKLRYRINHCPNIEIASGNEDGYPKTITLDYGDSTVLHNGTVLSGMIEITISAPRSSQDYQRDVEYMGFGVDSMIVDGYSTITIDKVDTMFRMHESALTFTLADGTVVNRTSSRIWQWIEGMDTKDDQSDDVFTITMLAEVTMTIDGTTETYKKETTTPLKRIGDCPYIVEGVVDISLNGSVTTLDYGDGTCDEIAVMTDADGNQTEIDLSERRFKSKEEKNKNNNGKKNSSDNGNSGNNQSGNGNSGGNQSGNKG